MSGGGSRGPFNGDEAAAAEDALVDEAMAAPTEQRRLGEVVGGQFEISVVELFDFDGFLLAPRVVAGFGGGEGGGGWC